MQKEKQIKSRYKKRLSSPSVAVGDLPIFVSDGMVNERKEIRRSRIKSGMTPLFNNNAFTLIELLVVVLIIGILAAAALPQYQKAVDKARFTQLITASKAIVDAQQVYYLANGVYTYRADELSLEFPLSENGAKFQTKTWECIVNYANDSPRTSCMLYKPQITLQWALGTQTVYCCAYSADKYKGEALCQDVTKKKTPYNKDGFYACYLGTR